jgi:hypothetical protein
MTGLVEKLKTQKGIVIEQRAVTGGNQFFHSPGGGMLVRAGDEASWQKGSPSPGGGARSRTCETAVVRVGECPALGAVANLKRPIGAYLAVPTPR